LTRAAAEEAFLSSRFRLNGIKLLKKSVLVCPGDKLDLVISEDDGTLGKRVRVITVEERKRDSYRVSLRCWRSKFTRLKLFLIARPPLALLALVLLLCSLGLLILDGRIHLHDVKDPDVEKVSLRAFFFRSSTNQHWNKLLLELSNLEFCFTNSSFAKTLSDSYAAADVFPQNLAPSFHSDGNEDNSVISQSVEQRVLLYPTDVFKPGVGYVLTANMRGRHIVIKG
uniref:TMEM219 domain-containing protein n=1 Tax=Echinostoma caproni TaxID=27848 RepID=A0A183BFF0_9TREM